MFIFIQRLLTKIQHPSESKEKTISHLIDDQDKSFKVQFRAKILTKTNDGKFVLIFCTKDQFDID